VGWDLVGEDGVGRLGCLMRLARCEVGRDMGVVDIGVSGFRMEKGFDWGI